VPRRARFASYPQLAYFVPSAFPSCQMGKNGCQINALLITLSATPPVTAVVSCVSGRMWVTGTTHSFGCVSRTCTTLMLTPYFVCSVHQPGWRTPISASSPLTSTGRQAEGAKESLPKPNWLRPRMASHGQPRDTLPVRQAFHGLVWPRMASHGQPRDTLPVRQAFPGLAWPRVAPHGQPRNTLPVRYAFPGLAWPRTAPHWPATGPHRLQRCEGPNRILSSTTLCRHTSWRVL